MKTDLLSLKSLSTELKNSGYLALHEWLCRDFDFSDTEPGVPVDGIYHQLELNPDPAGEPLHQLLPNHISVLLPLSLELLRSGCADWLVFNEMQNQPWIRDDLEHDYSDVVRLYLKSVSSKNKLKGAISIEQGSVFESLCIFYLHGWILSVGDVHFYHKEKNLLLWCNHHGTLFLLSTNFTLIQQLKASLATYGLTFKRIPALEK